ncbi:MAG: pilus assembly protein PilP [Gammaproteobacteria bacterium]|nr:pilus assembly protein PilP [Gammaproteobacteria bacterium]
MAVLNGCSSSYGDLDDWIKETKERTKGQIGALPVVKTYDAFTYAAKDLRDPFTPYQEEPVETKQSEGGPRPGWVREALEQFPLDSLSFVGTLEKNGVQWGLIQGPDQTIYRVQVGNHLGKNFGEIVSINERAVLLKELIPNGSGGWVAREASLALPE